MDKAGEVDGATVVADGEATEMFEASEASLDRVAMFVGAGVRPEGDRAVAPGRDHGSGVGRGDLPWQVVAVIGFVGQGSRGLPAIEKARG